MGYTELLNSLSLQASAGTAEVGVPIMFSIVPDVSSAKVTEIQMVDVDFEFIAKGFVFANDDLDDETTTGTLPIQDLVSNPPAVTPGVPGLLGRIRGQMPVAIPGEVAPRLEVEWKVWDARGRDALARGDAVGTPGPGGTSFSVLFLPDVIELLNDDDPGTTHRRVYAHVTMFVGTTNVGSRDLPVIEVQVRRLAMPTILTLFVHKHYTGMMLVVLPQDTAIYTLGAVIGKIQALRTLLAPFSGTRLAHVLSAMAHLESRLSTESHIQFRKADSIKNLNDITLETDWFNTEAEDEMSSVLLLGPPRRGCDFFNDRSFKVFEGVFALKTAGALMAGSRDLHSDWPSSEPMGYELIRRLAPPGGIGDPDTFGDALSSLRFLEIPEE